MKPDPFGLRFSAFTWSCAAWPCVAISIIATTAATGRFVSILQTEEVYPKEQEVWTEQRWTERIGSFFQGK
jgi:hypothetical protein